MRSIDWFIAWRYLFSRERKALVSAITIISMTGIAVGVAALIVVIGVMDGATKLLYGRMVNLYPHLQIMDASREQPLRIDPDLLARLRARPDVVLAEPVIQKMAIIQSSRGVESQKQGMTLIGVDEISSESLYSLPGLKPGQQIRPGPRQILLGAPLAKKIQAKPGSVALVIASDQARSANASPFKATEERVQATFSTGFYAFDANTAFISNDEIRRIFSIPAGYADYIHVRLKDPSRADAVRAELGLGEQYATLTWIEQNGDFFSAIKIQKFGLFVILLLIILVAAFNIIGTLILMVTEKTREIGILRAVGASEGLNARIFLLEGMLIGLMGTLLGLIIGLAICALIPLIKIPMPAQIYNFDHLPVTVKPLSVLLIVISSMLICTLSALFPARQAAKLNPVEALRYD